VPSAAIVCSTVSERSAAFDLLVACSRPDVDERMIETSLRTTNTGPLLKLAKFHRVDGLVYERLREVPSAPQHVLVELAARYQAAVTNHMRALWALKLVADVLDGIGCRWAVFKGPVAVESLYEGVPGRRGYLDLDVLVEPAALGDALLQFEHNGGRVLDRNWIGMRRQMRGELHISLPIDVPIDLHWNLIDMHRRRMNLDTDAMLERARPISIGGLSVRTLDPVDTTIHLAFHAAYSGADRLLWLKDVERAAAILHPDWEELTARAERANVGRGVGLILERCRRTLRADIPEHVGPSLVGSRLLRFADAVDRIFPWQYGFSRMLAPGRLLARSIGHGPVGGAGWVLSRVIRNLDPWQEHRTSTFTARGDTRDRAAFVDAVETLGRAETGRPGTDR